MTEMILLKYVNLQVKAYYETSVFISAQVYVCILFSKFSGFVRCDHFLKLSNQAQQ